MFGSETQALVTIGLLAALGGALCLADDDASEPETRRDVEVVGSRNAVPSTLGGIGAREETASEILETFELKNAKGDRLADAIAQAQRISAFVEPAAQTDSTSPTGWQEIGAGIHNPFMDIHYAGRVNVARYAYDVKNDTTALFLGTPGGGIWKPISLALFAVWQPVSENLAGSPAVGDFVIHGDEPNKMLVGTGEIFRYSGTGFYRTEDAGDTWTQVPDGGTTPEFVLNMAASRDDQNLVLIATTSGIFRTEDFGVSGTWVHGGHVHDVQQDPGDPDRWLATQTGVPILESTDGGLTFSPIQGHGGIGLGPGVGRMEIAFAESSPNFVYAIANGEMQCSLAGQPTQNYCDQEDTCAETESRCFEGNTATETPCQSDAECDPQNDGYCVISTCERFGSGRLWGIFRSGDGGKSWTEIESTQDIAGGNQGFHAIAIAVDPKNEDRVIAGMTSSIMTDNATSDPVLWNRQARANACDDDGDGTFDLPQTDGCDLAISHPDFTDFRFAPEDVDPSGSTIAIANDGGIYLYDVDTNTVEADRNLLGLTISDLMAPVATHAGAYADSDLHFAGLWDNGVLRIDKTNARPLLLRDYGDGGSMSVSATNEDIVGISRGLGWSRFQSTDGTQSIQSNDCKNYCQLPTGEWTNTSCRNPETGQPDDSLCDDVGGTCNGGGLAINGRPTVLANQVSSSGIDEFYTLADNVLLSKPALDACGWEEIPSSTTLPSDVSLTWLDMANNSSGRVFYAGTRSGRVFVLDEIDGGGFGLGSWVERTPAILDAINYDFGGGQATAARSEFRQNTLYYATGAGHPSRALISYDRGKTWRDITGSLATDLRDANYWELVTNPRISNQAFLATSVGVFRTDSAASASPRWYRYDDNLPAVTNVQSIELSSIPPLGQPPVLTIGTAGRGFWEREIRSATGGFIPGTPGNPGDPQNPPLQLRPSPDGGPDGLQMTWSESCATGDFDYIVYEGSLGDGFTNHVPRTCSTQGNTHFDFDASPGHRYYLVATVGPPDEMSQTGDETQSAPGFASDGSERVTSEASLCYALAVGACP